MDIGDRVMLKSNGERGNIVHRSPRSGFDWSVLIDGDAKPTVYREDELTLVMNADEWNNLMASSRGSALGMQR